MMLSAARSFLDDTSCFISHRLHYIRPTAWFWFGRWLMNRGEQSLTPCFVFATVSSRRNCCSKMHLARTRNVLPVKIMYRKLCKSNQNSWRPELNRTKTPLNLRSDLWLLLPPLPKTTRLHTLHLVVQVCNEHFSVRRGSFVCNWCGFCPLNKQLFCRHVRFEGHL